MITSRETRRWVIPKGGRMVGKTDPQAAAQEAYEEAGVQGETLDTVIGHFRYGKRLKTGAVQACVVAVYPLEVLIQLGAWPEDQQRQRRWMPQAEAAEAVHEAELAGELQFFKVVRCSEDKAHVIAVSTDENEFGSPERAVMEIDLIQEKGKWHADAYSIVNSFHRQRDSTTTPPYW